MGMQTASNTIMPYGSEGGLTFPLREQVSQSDLGRAIEGDPDGYRQMRKTFSDLAPVLGMSQMQFLMWIRSLPPGSRPLELTRNLPGLVRSSNQSLAGIIGCSVRNLVIDHNKGEIRFEYSVEGLNSMEM